MNCRREVISFSTESEISCSVSLSLRPLKNSAASSIAKVVVSRMPRLPPGEPCRASLRSREPWHSAQGFSLQTDSVPRPWHSGQAPYGLLSEKRRGSTSGKEKPSSGQAYSEDMTCSEPSE